VGNLVVAAVYLLLGAAVGQFFAAFGLFPAPIWLPAGLAAAAAMLGGWRLVPGIFAGSFVVNATFFGSDPVVAAAISVGNALGPLAGAQLTRHFRPATGLFTRFRGVVAFLGGVVLLHSVLTASVGTLSLWLLGGTPAGDLPAIWSAWLLCDAGGTFYFAPSLALWMGIERTPRDPGRRAQPLPGDMAVWLGTAALACLVFSRDMPARLPSAQLVFLLAVPLSWIALRISLRAAYGLLTLICVIASAGTVAGLGPFQSGMVANPMQSVGMLIVLCAMNILTLLALVSERREAEAGLADMNRNLEHRVAERTDALRRLAETDALTGIANRRSFLARGDAALREALQRGQEVSLVTFDLDHFKSINDTHGHAAGDAVLRLAAERCAALLRRPDLLGRLGGEEFALLLPGVGAAGALALAESLRAVLSLVPLPGGTRGRLSASFGVATAVPEDGGLSALLLRADIALYVAKESGRDRVEVAIPPGESGGAR
jgi:diguanylate cyclase (GGDEF)-like protein